MANDTGMSDGWFGLKHQVDFYLSVVNADKDEEGKYILEGQVVCGLDQAEMVVPGNVRYFTQGKPCNLAGGLRTTSYGMGIKVF